ncbi:MAG: DUF2934 domain-containing protein [Verrucomicrobiota bacterium]
MSDSYLIPKNKTLHEEKTLSYPPEARITQRAHQIYLENGSPSGRDLDHWLQAEYELAQMPIEELAKIPIRGIRKRNKRKSVVELIRGIVRNKRSKSGCDQKCVLDHAHSQNDHSYCSCSALQESQG